MSKLIIEVVKVVKVEKHPNADRLDIATVKGWNCVVGKDSIKVGDLVVYITPDDSILPEKLMRIIFSNTKIKPKTNRIRTIKLRGAISQGLIITQKQLVDHYPKIEKYFVEGKAVDKFLEITKYEPKQKSPFSTRGIQQVFKKQINPNFRKYSSINHLKNYPNAFDPDDYIIVTEKIHGTNFRAGYVPIHHHKGWKKWIKKIRSWFDRKNFKYPGYEFVYGSHNIQLQEKNKNNRKKRKSMKKYFKKNVYEIIVEKYDLRNKLLPNQVIYGEIYGANIQKKYNYGLKDSIDFVVIDMIFEGKWIDSLGVKVNSESNGLQYVPILFTGYWENCDIDKLVSGPSVLYPKHKVREGCVIKSVKERSSYMGRMIFKYLNPEYLLKKGNSDWH